MSCRCRAYLNERDTGSLNCGSDSEKDLVNKWQWCEGACLMLGFSGRSGTDFDSVCCSGSGSGFAFAGSVRVRVRLRSPGRKGLDQCSKILLKRAEEDCVEKGFVSNTKNVFCHTNGQGSWCGRV